jgi:hypothetical protein
VLPAPTGPKKASASRSLLIAALLLTALGVYGCGTVVDHEKLQDTVQASLEKSIHEKIKNVDCPSGQSVDPGTTFTCTVTFADDRREVATLRIRDKEADISMVGLKPEK